MILTLILKFEDQILRWLVFFQSTSKFSCFLIQLYYFLNFLYIIKHIYHSSRYTWFKQGEKIRFITWKFEKQSHNVLKLSAKFFQAVEIFIPCFLRTSLARIFWVHFSSPWLDSLLKRLQKSQTLFYLIKLHSLETTFFLHKKFSTNNEFPLNSITYLSKNYFDK